MLEIVVRTWRVTRGIPGGVHVWFDPAVESVRLFRTPTSEQRSLAAQVRASVDGGDPEDYLDKVGSVSVSETEAELASDRSEELLMPGGHPELPF